MKCWGTNVFKILFIVLHLYCTLSKHFSKKYKTFAFCTKERISKIKFRISCDFSFSMIVDSSQSSLDSSLDPLIDNSSNIDDRQLVKTNSSRFNINMIISYGKELLCIIAFILTTFASVQKSSPKVSRAVTPVPFFSSGSLVEDYYYGQLSPTQTKVSLSDLSFVLYYAP